MRRGVTRDAAGLLLLWLRASAEDMAHELRNAGWEEDERGLWRDTWGTRRDMHLYEAHNVMRREHV